MNEIEEGIRTLNALYDTLISGNHLPNSETSISAYRQYYFITLKFQFCLAVSLFLVIFSKADSLML